MSAQSDRYVELRRRKHARLRAKMAERAERLRALAQHLASDASPLVYDSPYSELDAALQTRLLVDAAHAAVVALSRHLNPPPRNQCRRCRRKGYAQ